MVSNLNEVARTPVGFAGIKSVVDMEQEDHTPSFFLAETLKVGASRSLTPSLRLP